MEEAVSQAGERLLIGGANKPENANQCEKMLSPRPNEDAKSSWGYTQGFADTDVAQNEIEVSERMHALSVFVNRCNGDGRIRSSCEGISISRDAVETFVSEDMGEHLVPKFDSTHRSIRFPDPQTRRAVTQGLINQKSVKGWRYLRVDLIGLLRELVRLGLVRQELCGCVQRILQSEPVDDPLLP